MNRKYVKLAKRHGVRLVGQVTGANGEYLRKAAQWIEEEDYIVRKIETLKLSDVQSQGLNSKSVGKTLTFND